MAERPPIERAFFRTAEDGTTVFFPWGLTRRGYALRSDSDRRRAARAGSLLMGAVVGIGVWGGHAVEAALREMETPGPGDALAALAGPALALALVVGGYALWAWRFVEGFTESPLRLSREDRLREAAALVAPWKLAIVGVSVLAMSGLLVWLDPRVWWLGALGMAIGVGTIVWSAMLRRIASGALGAP